VRYLRLPANAHTGLREPIYSYAVLKHADLLTCVRDPASFSSNSATVMPVPKLSMLHDDPPAHTHLRRLVNKAFTMQRVNALAGLVEAITRELVEAINTGDVELMSALSAPLPVRVIAVMLGVPAEAYPSFRAWAEAVVAYVGLSAEERRRRTLEMMAYLGGVVAARRKEPTEDLITAFTQAEIEGATLSDTDIVRLVAVLLVAGHETTANLLGNMMGILADRPELYARARVDRTLVEPIIEETLRFESPVQRFPRVVAKDVTLGGVTIPEGHIVDMMYGAANRDPEVFEDADSFVVERSTREHVAFGHGIHFCLGAPLARLEAKIALNVLLDRFVSLKRGATPAVRQRIAPVSLGYKTLPLWVER